MIGLLKEPLFDWPISTALSLFWSPELGSRCYFPDVNSRSYNTSATQAIFIQRQLEDGKRYDRAVVQLVPTLTSGTRVAAGKPGAISFGAL